MEAYGDEGRNDNGRLGGSFADDLQSSSGLYGAARRPAVRVSLRGRVLPQTVWGRVGAALALLLICGAGVAGALMVRNFLLHDEHFTVADSASIQIAGNSHLTRPQLLSVFGGDVERNIFSIPLAERRMELERLPWVKHATVMRLLPDHVRVAIVERTPVAFVRQGNAIGLVDANGVLLDMADTGGPGSRDGHRGGGEQRYSFPVLTGISANEPLSTRAARMKIYLGFVADLDSTGEKISQRLSEVDVSSPEDVKAILPDGAAAQGSSDILVHFGDDRFLERYRQYRQHLAEWLAQYPRLSSVDMRYERQVVLEMQPGAAPATGDAAAANTSKAPAVAPATATAGTTKTVPGAVAAEKTATAMPSAKTSAAMGAAPKNTAGLSHAQHLTTAFDVVSGGVNKTTKPAPSRVGVQGAPPR